MDSPVYSVSSPSYSTVSPRRSRMPVRLSIDTTQNLPSYTSYLNSCSQRRGSCEYNSPQGSCEYKSPQGSCEYNSPQGSCEYNSPQGSCEYNSPQGSYEYTSPQESYNLPQGSPSYASCLNPYSSRRGSYGSEQSYNRSRRNALASPTHIPAGYEFNSAPGSPYSHGETSPVGYNSMPGSPYSHDGIDPAAHNSMPGSPYSHDGIGYGYDGTSSVIGSISETPIFSPVNWDGDNESPGTPSWGSRAPLDSRPVSPRSGPVSSPVNHNEDSYTYFPRFSPQYHSRPVSLRSECGSYTSGQGGMSSEVSDAIKSLQGMVERAEGVIGVERVVEMLAKCAGEIKGEIEGVEGEW